MTENSLKRKTITGAAWKFGEKISAQVVSFVVSIILARLLLPEDYGIIALVSVFITICDKLVVSGFGTALVQKKDADNAIDQNSLEHQMEVNELKEYATLFISRGFSKEETKSTLLDMANYRHLRQEIIKIVEES